MKTDNTNLFTKLDLRRYFLNKYKMDFKVFDCCQGSGVIWNRLRKDYFISSYWGVDKKPQKGRLKIDSIKLIGQTDDNVIDIDTYGSPWKHWFQLLPKINSRTIVFLTIGFTAVGGGSVADLALQAAGLGKIAKIAPNGLMSKIHDITIPYCLKKVSDYNLKIVEIKQAQEGNAKYIGVVLEKENRI